MAYKRRLIFLDTHWYHIFNRGIEGRPLFLIQRDYERFISTLQYYQYSDISLRYSYFIQLSPDIQKTMLQQITQTPKRVSIAASCLMPNHFHFLIRQNCADGIHGFMSDVCNSYSKYFNTKNTRIGPLFQSVFKAVFIENDEQFLHVSRYIHINPYVSSLCQFSDIFSYPWSSLSAYIFGATQEHIETSHVTSFFKDTSAHRSFIEDQMDYAKKKKQMEHVFLE